MLIELPQHNQPQLNQAAANDLITATLQSAVKEALQACMASGQLPQSDMPPVSYRLFLVCAMLPSYPSCWQLPLLPCNLHDCLICCQVLHSACRTQICEASTISGTHDVHVTEDPRACWSCLALMLITDSRKFLRSCMPRPCDKILAQ